MKSDKVEKIIYNEYNRYTQSAHSQTNFCLRIPNVCGKSGKESRTKEELDTVIAWLIGFDAGKMQQLIDDKVTFEAFFMQPR